MITETDLSLARKFLPALAGKKDIVSVNKIKSTAKVIGLAMLPERQALADLVSRLEQIEADATFKEVFTTAKAQGVIFRGKPWREELAAAKAIVATYPLPEVEEG